MNLLIIGGIFSWAVNIGIGLFVFFNNPKRRLNRWFAFFNIAIGSWSLGSFLLNVIPYENIAINVLRLSYLFAILILPAYLNFIYSAIEEKPNKLVMVFVWGLVTFFAFNLPTKLFIKGVRILPGNGLLISLPGKVYFMYLAVFAVVGFYGIILLWRAIKRTPSKIKNRQLKYILIAYIIAFLAGMNYFMSVFQLSNIYPIDDYILLVSFSIIAYAIVRHRLMDIRIVAVRTLVFVVVYVPILAVPYVLGYVFKLSWVLPTVLETIFAPGGLFIYLKIQEIAERKILQKEYNQAGEIRDLAGGLIRLDDVGELGRVIVGGLEKITKAENISLYILQENKTSYSMSYSRGELKSPKSLAVNNPLVEYIQDQREPVILSELQNKAKEAAQVLIEKKAAVAVPAVEKENLMGLIFLGEKPDNRAYSQIELTALGVLARQVGFTVQVIQFIEEKEEMQRARNEMQRMKEFEYLTSAIGHEIGNGIQAIELASSVLVRKRDLTDMFAENKKAENAVREQVANIKNNIENIRQVSEALKGYIHKGDIGKIEKVDLQDLIKRVLVLAKVRNLGMKAADIRIKGTADVVCNPSALQSVFSNLINNSYDAIIQEKQYREENNDTREYKGIIEITITGGSDAAEIHIRDNGFGMSQEVQKQIFIPLFTTKSHEDKKDRRLTGGTGIGMFTIQKMLASQGGYIEVYESEEHKGTDFLIKILGRQ